MRMGKVGQLERHSVNGNERAAFSRQIAHHSSRRPPHDSQHAGHRSHATCHSSWGFTLMEIMVVLTLILILATFAMPMYQLAVTHAREAVLRDDLFTMRKLIDEYTLDKQKPPSSLDDLVEAGYLRGGVPVDPFTGSNQTWRTDTEDVPLSPDQSTTGIVDVHSGAEGTALDGTEYSSW